MSISCFIPRGIPQVEVTFDIDASGILSVTAKDKATNKSQSIRIEASTGLKDEEIERMKKDAELHAEEDKHKKELVEARNIADTLSYTTQKAIKDAGDKLTEDEKKPVEEALAELDKVKNGDDLEAIKKASETLSEAAQKIGEKLYKAAQEAEAAAKTGEPAASASDDATASQAKDAEVDDSAPADGEKK